jgi:DnaJ-domain-containing protein 1
MSQGEDGLVSFFFYILFVYPLTSWFLKPGRFPRKRGLTYAISFLAILALGKTYLEFQDRGPNHYNELHITRASTPLEIKKAYKKMSLELHPDKNKSPTAAEEFARVKEAYDTLMDPELREVYNKFGAEGIKQNRRFDETQLLLEIAVFYVTWGMLAFVLTLGKASSTARNWIYTGQIAMLIAEISLMLQETKLPSWLLPMWTEHEFVFLMRSLFPAFMNGCRCLCGFLYVDVDEQARQKMEHLEAQNKDILMVLRDIQVNMQSIQVRRGGCASAVPGWCP